jgi:anti-sigma-K factor RskA
LSINEYIQSGAIEACIYGLANPEEELYYNTMRNNNPEVVAYANEIEDNLALQLMANAPLQPNSKVKDAFMQTITNIPLQKETKSTPIISIKTRTKRSNIMQYAVAACLAIALGSIVFNIMMASKLKQQQAVINKFNVESSKSNVDFLKNPEITPVALNGVGYHAICRCSLFWDKSKKEAYIQIHHLMDTGNEKEYQLWATINGKTVSVGLFRFDENKKPIIIKNVPDNITEFIVTVENKGGATSPNTDVFLKGIVTT